MIDLYAIGPVHPGTELGWTKIDRQGTVLQQSLGTSALSGLAYNPRTRLYYTIAPTHPGGPRLRSLSTSGTLQTLGAVGPNLTGGLTYHRPNDSFYALANDPSGWTALHQIPLSGPSIALSQIAPGVASGLTYVPNDNKFYALVTQDNFTWFYEFTLNGTVTKRFGAGLRVLGGLCHSPSENLFYFVANQTDGFSRLWSLKQNGSVGDLMGLGYRFNQAAISTSPWFGGSIEVKRPLENERFVTGEPVGLDAGILDPTGQPSWDSDGMTWSSNRDGLLGTGAPTVSLSSGQHVITAAKERLIRTVNVRVFADLWALYQAPPAQAEINRVLGEFTINWIDGAPGDPTQQWATYPGFPFDQAAGKPSRTAVVCKLDALRHQRFAQPLPFGTTPTAYEQVRKHTHTLNVSLGNAVNTAAGGVVNLNRLFTLWSANSSQPTAVSPYIHSLYLLNHESRHNEPGDAFHTSCTSWTGAAGIPSGMDATFEPGSGYARAALYLMWIYKYSLHDPSFIRAEAKSVAATFKDRFCARPTSANPAVQALLTEIWNA